MSACVCLAGVCRDPWTYLCVGAIAAATEWAVRSRHDVTQTFGPHEQTARQAVQMVGDILLRRPVGTTRWERA